jgi:hypothetical protein
MKHFKTNMQLNISILQILSKVGIAQLKWDSQKKIKFSHKLMKDF